ncbi:hypothetical protein CC80DRAFT_61959 [Byssothecium circinans]|uniref:Nucleoporin Nup159/Nup146 N-terminal domain-containing protein n=1 Tax=Byssothecium circinans TaxID=147558 RepID=A0A6A5TWD3_9PLEO|nr:hypothetical protein CC80DRAFT_61959 [Byssothecium circinans]
MALASNAASNLQLSVNAGEEVPEITTEALGFASIGRGLTGPPKLKLLPSPWPNDNLPPASATLLSVASRRGLVAAASPDTLVITSTESVRNALKAEINAAPDVISDFKPDVSIPVARLRHVAFSTDEDLLFINQEGGGRFSVYQVDHLLNGDSKPALDFTLHDQGVRAMLPCTDPSTAHYTAVVGDMGRLDIVDMTTGVPSTVDTNGKIATCASWSTRGKAYVVGFKDGTAAAYQVTQNLLGTIPRPPNVEESYLVSSISYLSNDDFFMVHSPPEEEADQDSLFHFVKTKFLKNETPKFKDFTFRKTMEPLLWPCFEGDAPTRTHPPRYSVSRLKGWEPLLNDMLVVSGSYSIDITIIINAKQPIVKDQEVGINEYQKACLDDHRKAQVPRQSLGEDLDSVLIGESLDLSSKELVQRPSKRIDGLDESPTPLPAYFLLTQEGLLQAYWVIWDKSLENKIGYPGLTALGGSVITPATNPTPPMPSKPIQGTPSTQPSLFPGKTTSTPQFGAATVPKPSQPTFGAAGFTGLPTAQPRAPTAEKPAQAIFGTAGLPRPSPFLSTSNASSSPAPGGFASAASQSSPFTNLSNKGSTSGSKSSPFANLSNKGSTSGSPFHSFGGSGAAMFSGLDKQSTMFSGTANGSKEDSFTSNASTINLTGSSFDSMSSFGDTRNRERDEATPTPALPPSGFKLGSTFKPDGTAKDDLPKPATPGSSFFGGGFSSALTGAAPNPPATPEKSSQNVSTTPATQPKQRTLSPSQPKEAPPKESIVPEDAPLPPDPMTYKAPKMEDDVPPIAGSPPVQVEAPSSSVPSSPLDDEDDEGDLSIEEERDEETGGETGDETVEPSPSDAARRSRSAQSNHQTPPVYPAAPTPPHALSQQHKPAPTPYGQPPKASPLSFDQSTTPAKQSPSSLGNTRRDPLPGSGPSLSASIQQQSQPPPPEPQFADLVDDEDERIRQELAKDIEPSRHLDDFLARQEYSGAALNKTGHAAQIEIVYRDINNMVDTLGLNWRSLKSFMKYHERPQRYTEVIRETLDEVNQQGEDGPWFEEWCLTEIEDLKNLENELEQGLDEGRVRNLVDKLSQLTRFLREKARLSTKINDVRRQIINRKGPEKLDAVRKASLPKELADHQKTLRKEYARLLTLLGQAEEAIMLLKSKLASRNAENGRAGVVPTVDAIKKTINKLIAITETKSAEITRLETQFRKAGLADTSHPTSSSSRKLGTPLRQPRGLRSGSPFATPPTNRSRMSLSELNRRALTPEVESTPTKGCGLFYTPEGTPSADKTLTKLGNMDDNDLAQLREKARRRRKIAQGLETALMNRGVRQTRVST